MIVKYGTLVLMQVTRTIIILCIGNAVWEDEISARRALVGLGHRPLSVMGDQDTQDKAEEREPEQNV